MPYRWKSGVFKLNIFIRNIALSGFLLATLWFSGCRPKNICPAYQSVFYLDSKIADEEFSPFDKDSMPRIEETVRKTDVLLVIRLGKKKIDKRMAIIPMITIFPEQADSTLAMADSLAADSAMMEQAPEEEIVEDSSEITEPENPELENPAEEETEEIGEPEPPKAIKEVPKPVKKVDLKDPELSDPTLKAEFEESFDDAPSFEEDQNTPPPPDPEPPINTPKKKGPKKADPKPDAIKPKEAEPEDDKF